MEVTLSRLAADASRVANDLVKNGRIELVEFNGAKGVWASTPLGRFFVQVGETVLLSTPHEKSFVAEGGEEHSVLVWAPGKRGRHVQMDIDTRSGRVRNFAEIKDLLEELREDMEEAEKRDREDVDSENLEMSEVEAAYFWSEELGPLLLDLDSGDILNTVDLKEADVHPYRRADGTQVKGYRQQRPEAKHQVEGHQFLGHASSEDGKRYEVHQNKISRNQFALLGDDGSHAEPGTSTGPWEGYTGTNIKGLVQGKHIERLGRPVATPVRDEASTEDGKRRQVLAIARALPMLQADLEAKLRMEPSKERSLALAVLMIARHLIRIGDGIGYTKGKETRGLTELRPGVDAIPKQNGVEFSFVGKAGKAWLKHEDAPETTQVLSEQINNAEANDRLFWYPSGKRHRQLTAEDVREYLEPHGFTPHRFRNYAGSYAFYAHVAQATKSGPAEDEKSRKKLVNAATKAAAAILNDTPGAAKAYILSELVDEVMRTGTLRNAQGLRPLRLAEGIESFWLPSEEDFVQWCEHTAPGFHHGMGEDDSESVDMAEVYYDAILLWEPLREGDRWVTLKPHGPDSDSYVRVIIRQNHDGTATVVGGARHLMNLRLAKVGERRKIEQEEKAKSKVLTPEQADKEKAAREARAAAYEQAHTSWASSVLGMIGAKGVDPEELVRAYGTEIKAAKNPNRQLDDSKRNDQIERILNGETPTGDEPPDLSGDQDVDEAARKIATPIDGTEGSELKQRILEANVADILGRVPRTLEHASDALKEAWNAALQNPETVAKIAEATSRLEATKKELRKQQSPRGTIRVLNRMAFYVEDGEAAEASKQLLSDALARTEYHMTSRFWEQVENAGVGVREHFTNGAVEALTALAGKYGGGSLLDSSMIRLVGHEAMAAAIASDIRSRGPEALDQATNEVEKMIEDKHLPTVEASMQSAKEFDDERVKLDQEAAANGLVSTAAAAARTKLTIARQKALGYAAGSLESAAALADFMRRANPQGIWIQPGDQRDRLVRLLEKTGMREGQEFNLGTDDTGGVGSIYIPEEHLPKLLKASRIDIQLDRVRGAIKNHTAQDGIEFHVPGMAPTIDVEDANGDIVKEATKLKPGQIATIQMFENEASQGPDHGILANAKVGLGKTLIFGSAASRLLDRIAKGEVNANGHGFVVLPAFLADSTLAGVQKFFPDLDVVVAHQDKAKRHQQYGEKHQMTILSLDTLRGDMEDENSPLRKMMADPESKPGYIFGDEAHLAFTPNENENPEQQSRRSRALGEFRADHMMMLTGTPLRRSSAEVWKILNHLRPGQYGSLSQWMSRFGKIGEGSGAFGDSMQDLFQRTIDSATITEDEPAPVKHNKKTRFIELGHEQWQAYNEAEKKYHIARADPMATRKTKQAALATKMKRQRETIYAGQGTSNKLIQQLQTDLASHIERGDRGIVHCTSLAAVDAVCNAYKPGQMIKVTGADSRADRKLLLKALNTGGVVEGGRAALGNREGVVTSIDSGGIATVRQDDGSEFKTHEYNLESKIIGAAGTSNDQGVLSAGLNLQGTNWNVHFQLPSSGSVLTQRDARNLRTGQKQDVSSYYYVPETPVTREKWRSINRDLVRMKFVDDPAAYDDTETFNTREFLPE